MKKPPDKKHLALVDNVEKGVEKNGEKNGRTSGGQFVAGQGHPRLSKGPKKGAPNAGRPPDEFKEWCRAMVSSPEASAQVEAVLGDKTHPAYPTMWKAVSERGYGKAAQPLTNADGSNIPAMIAIQIVDTDGGS